MLKVGAILLFALVNGIGFLSNAASASQQAASDIYKSDSCVLCHSRVSTPSDLSTRYLEWHMSPHAANGVGCEKCHGGDPTQKDVNKAHLGVYLASTSRRRPGDVTVAETCGECHQAIAKSFVESAHYQKLRTSGMGPTCTSCHAHMAASVRRSPSQGESLCTYCHNTLGGLLPQRPDIPASSKATLDAIQRTQYVLAWTNNLIAEAQKGKIAVDAEENEAAAVKASLERAKAAWHTFNLSGVLEVSNKAFVQAVAIKDRLNKKLGHD